MSSDRSPKPTCRCGHDRDWHKFDVHPTGLCWGPGKGDTAMVQQYGCGCKEFKEQASAE